MLARPMKARFRWQGNLKLEFDNARESLRLPSGAGFGTEMHPMKKVVSHFALFPAVAGFRVVPTR